MSTESYLVTGGCGLQGSHIVDKLRIAYPDAAVAVLSRNPATQFEGVRYLKGDVASAADVSRVLAETRPSVVFHCAAALTVGRAPISDADVRRANVEGTRVLLAEAARAGCVRAFVNCGSASVVQVDTFADIVGGDEKMPILDEGAGGMIYPLTKVGVQYLHLCNEHGLQKQQKRRSLLTSPRPRPSASPKPPTPPAACAPAPSAQPPSTASATTTRCLA